MIIGLTGGIGSGKSAIARGLQQMGYRVYDTDSEAKRLLETDADLQARVKDLLGDECYADGHYQTAVVAAKVFADEDLLQALNAIVHPAVEQDILDSSIHQLHDSPLIIESALLFESGLNQICDTTIAVIAPEELRLQRVIARDKTDINKVRARMRAQMSDAERAAKADLVVCNDGTLTIEQLCRYITQHL